MKIQPNFYSVRVESGAGRPRGEHLVLGLFKDRGSLGQVTETAVPLALAAHEMEIDVVEIGLKVLNISGAEEFGCGNLGNRLPGLNDRKSDKLMHGCNC